VHTFEAVHPMRTRTTENPFRLSSSNESPSSSEPRAKAHFLPVVYIPRAHHTKTTRKTLLSRDVSKEISSESRWKKKVAQRSARLVFAKKASQQGEAAVAAVAVPCLLSGERVRSALPASVECAATSPTVKKSLLRARPPPPQERSRLCARGRGLPVGGGGGGGGEAVGDDEGEARGVVAESAPPPEKRRRRVYSALRAPDMWPSSTSSSTLALQPALLLQQLALALLLLLLVAVVVVDVGGGQHISPCNEFPRGGVYREEEGGERVVCVYVRECWPVWLARSSSSVRPTVARSKTTTAAADVEAEEEREERPDKNAPQEEEEAAEERRMRRRFHALFPQTGHAHFPAAWPCPALNNPFYAAAAARRRSLSSSGCRPGLAWPRSCLSPSCLGPYPRTP